MTTFALALDWANHVEEWLCTADPDVGTYMQARRHGPWPMDEEVAFEAYEIFRFSAVRLKQLTTPIPVDLA